MHRTLIGMLMACVLGGCAATPVVAPVASDSGAAKVAAAPDAPAPAVIAPAASDDAPGRRSGPWIGAAGASDFMLPGTQETVLGVWVDVPAASQKAHAPASVALVIDTSGSMGGAKIENARAAARNFIDKLPDGDMVSVHTFSDEAFERIPPTVLNASTRPAILRVIASLEPSGGTNMFDGLRLGEARVLAAPPTHAVRRVVLISDGIANVGPSSPEILGSLAARGADGGTQVTAIGVGLDYDERTLNALAIRSSGRLYHLSEPHEMASIMERELGLLQATAATGAVVEVVPAPGVEILAAEGIRADRGMHGSLIVPLGTMFGGQHREMLVRVRVNAAGDGSKPLASVRFRFRDPSDNNLERIQEVVARYQVTGDRLAVEQHANDKTRSIQATFEASKVTLAAAQDVNGGNFEAADKQLAAAEEKLKQSAMHMKDEQQKQRIMANAAQIATARTAARAAAAAPPAAKRARALELNRKAMMDAGF